MGKRRVYSLRGQGRLLWEGDLCMETYGIRGGREECSVDVLVGNKPGVIKDWQASGAGTQETRGEGAKRRGQGSSERPAP